MLQPHPQGVLLHLRAQPGARREGIVGVQADRLKVAVHAAPEKGKANAAIIEVLAEELGLKRSQIQLVSGETSPKKTVLIKGESIEMLQARIEEHVTKVQKK
jgi:uncharacterized protein